MKTTRVRSKKQNGVLLSDFTKPKPKKSNSLIGTINAWDGIPVVDSLEGLLPYQVVKTYNYDLVKPHENNRHDKKRQKNFEKIIDKGEFNEKATIFLVDIETGCLFDNHHKRLAMIEKGLPLTFMLGEIDDRLKTMVGIAKHNNSNSQWKAYDKYIQSLKLDFPVAMELKKYKDSLDRDVPTNKFNPWNMLLFSLGRNIEGGVKIEDYKNDKYAKILKSKQFERDFKALKRIISKCLLISRAAKTSDTLKSLSTLNKDDEFCLTTFAVKFDQYYMDYKPKSKKVDAVNEEIFRILRKR